MKFFAIASISIMTAVSASFDYTWDFYPSDFDSEDCLQADPSCDPDSGSNFSDLDNKVKACSAAAGTSCRYEVLFSLVDAADSIQISAPCTGGSTDQWIAIDMSPLKAVDGPAIPDLITITASWVGVEVNTVTSSTVFTDPDPEQSTGTEESTGAAESTDATEGAKSIRRAHCVFNTYEADMPIPAPLVCLDFDVSGLKAKEMVMENGDSQFGILVDLLPIKTQDNPLLLAQVDDWDGCGKGASSVDVDWLSYYGRFYGSNTATVTSAPTLSSNTAQFTAASTTGVSNTAQFTAASTTGVSSTAQSTPSTSKGFQTELTTQPAAEVSNTAEVTAPSPTGVSVNIVAGTVVATVAGWLLW